MRGLVVFIGFGALTAWSARVPFGDIVRRAQAKAYPSQFQMWEGKIVNRPEKTDLENLTSHGLIMQGPYFWGLTWDTTGITEGEATRFVPASIDAALAKRKLLLSMNPNLIMIGEIRNYDAMLGYLPADSEFWKRDAKGDKIPTVANYYALDVQNPAFQKLVGEQAKALIETGAVDGIMIDWAKDDRISIIEAVRRAVGDSAVIVGNVNIAATPKISPLMNGVFMEAIADQYDLAAYWKQAEDAVKANAADLREPKLVCLEVWGKRINAGGVKPGAQLNHMRAGLGLILTQSNGYFAYYPDGDTFDHQQYYYPIWSAPIGTPLAGSVNVQGAYSRQYSRGTVVYNPMANKPVALQFAEKHTSQATGVSGLAFTVPAYDGDIFIRDSAPTALGRAVRERSIGPGSRRLNAVSGSNRRGKPGAASAGTYGEWFSVAGKSLE